MIIKKSSTPIVCDMGGCKNKADYFIKIDSGASDYDSFKLCKDCALKIKTLLVKELKKEKGSEG